MKIEKLTDNKIRIILNTEELTKQNIDIKSLINNTDIAQNLFKNILKKAEKEVGFIVADSKLLIEAYVSTEGFFVITFTKFKSDTKLNNFKKVKSKTKINTSNPILGNVVFMFNDFEEFCHLCTYLNNCQKNHINNFAKQITLYEYNSKFYLTLSGINKQSKNIPIFHSSISEFGKLISNSPAFENKLLEHGKIIFKHNALKNGIKYFV